MKPEELKQIAEQATPGPWEAETDDRELYGRCITQNSLTADICYRVTSDENHKFIATMNPELALKLCALWEAAEWADKNEDSPKSALAHIRDALKALEDHK